jgi:hypothetical protein
MTAIGGFSTALVGTTLTVYYPNTDVMWDGVVRTLAIGSISGTVSTGTYSLVVGYNWGLTQVQLLPTASVTSNGAYVELCQIAVNTTTVSAVVSPGRINTKFLQTYVVRGDTSTAYSISVSDGSGNITW